MSIDFHPADYAPDLVGYTGQGPFRFWCQKVLPIVYDDSLSYYELLNKVVNYLNNVISDVSSVETNVLRLYTSYYDLQSFVNDNLSELTDTINTFTEYINNYFDNLDVQNEINNKLNAMASDGSLSRIVEPIVTAATPAIVTAWLNENITPTSPAIDKSLRVSDAAADAKVVGDRLNLKMDAILGEEIALNPSETHNGAYWNGTEYVSIDIYISKKFNVSEGDYLKIRGIQSGNNVLLCRFYNNSNVELYNTSRDVQIGVGLKELYTVAPVGCSYCIVNGTTTHNPTVMIVPFNNNATEIFNEINKTKMGGLKTKTLKVPSQIEAGKLWSVNQLIENELYTAYKYSCSPGENIEIFGAQASASNLLFRFYDSNDQEILNSKNLVTQGGNKLVDLTVPDNAEYVWINSINERGGWCYNLTYNVNSDDYTRFILNELSYKMDGVISGYNDLEATEVREGYLWNGSELIASEQYTAYKFECDVVKRVQVTGVQASYVYLLCRFYNPGNAEVGNTLYSVETSGGLKVALLNVPNNASYLWVNTMNALGGGCSVPIYDSDPNIIVDSVKNMSDKKMDAMKIYSAELPVEVEVGQLWHIDELIANEQYTAYKFDMTDISGEIRVKCVQPSTTNLGCRFYDENDSEIGNTGSVIQTGIGYKEAIVEVPANCSYCWVNTGNAYGGGIDSIEYDTDPEHLIASKGSNYTIEVTNLGVLISYGRFKLNLRKIGANNIFNIYSLMYNNNYIFATATDWFGPYNFTKIGGTGDFDSGTTGGNHSATKDGVTVTTGRTVSWSVKSKNVTAGNGVYDSLDISWHNEIMAGNTVKLDGTGEYCIDEYYRVHLSDGLKLEIEQYFIPRVNCTLNWYSGLQFASGTTLRDVIIPAYTDEIITTADVNSVAIDNKVVERCIAKGHGVECEMYLDRKWGFASRNVLKSMTGWSDSKMYFTQQGYADNPVNLIAGNIYCWRGHYKFTESF